MRYPFAAASPTVRMDVVEMFVCDGRMYGDCELLGLVVFPLAATATPAATPSITAPNASMRSFFVTFMFLP
jgi:hypothetical protein